MAFLQEYSCERYYRYNKELLFRENTRDILERIRKEEEKEDPEAAASPEKWEWMGDLIQILLFYEIYKRRHNTKRGILRF